MAYRTTEETDQVLIFLLLSQTLCRRQITSFEQLFSSASEVEPVGMGNNGLGSYYREEPGPTLGKFSRPSFRALGVYTQQALSIVLDQWLDLPLIPFPKGCVYWGYPDTDSFLVQTSPDQKEPQVDLVWRVSQEFWFLESDAMMWDSFVFLL